MPSEQERFRIPRSDELRVAFILLASLLIIVVVGYSSAVIATGRLSLLLAAIGLAGAGLLLNAAAVVVG